MQGGRHFMRHCRVSMVACWIGAVLPGSATGSVVAMRDVETSAPEEATDEQWAGLLHALDVLETASREEKLLALRANDEGDTPFYWFDLPPLGDASIAESVIERLRRYVLGEEDTWVLDRVVATLADEMLEETTPVFAALLHHPAPSVRMRAIEFLTEDSSLDDEEIVKLLEKRWSSERTPWVRAVLLTNLHDFESHVQVEHCMALLWDADLELARAAIDCVAEQRSPEGAASLGRRATTGAPLLRVAAVKALSSQPQENLRPLLSLLEPRLSSRAEPWFEPSLLAALEAAGSTLILSHARKRLWDENAAVARASIDILARHTSAADLPLLVRRAREGPEALRAHALGALDWAAPAPDLERLLLDSLAPDEPKMVRLTAIGALYAGPPIERFRPTLRALSVGDADEDVREAAKWLVAEHERETRSRCGGFPVGYEVTRMVVVGDETSTRCYDGPSIELPFERAWRLAAGSVVLEHDRFDDGDSIWFSVSNDDDKPCWVPAGTVRAEQPDDVKSAPTETPDFDMPLDATLDESFRVLEEQGIVETFDRGSTLVGVRLSVDPSDDEALTVLQEADKWAASPLGAAVRAFLPAVIERQGSRHGWDGWWRPGD